ncbi:MAG: MBL fold metallo-hydrolase [Chryseotalea sp. WA131a]|nr:MAG: MBL fold metallo-hydrolase [Chryseotalea sp. WA131a]
MKRFFVSIFLVSMFSAVFGQTIDNYNKALSVLIKSQTAMGESNVSILVSIKGSIHNQDHYETPEKTKDLPLQETYGFFVNEKVAYLYREMQNRANTYQRTAVSKQDSLYERGYYDKSFSKLSTQDFAFEVAKTLPTEMLRLAYENRKSLRYLGEKSLYYLISFSYATNQNATLYINQQTYMLEKVETLGYSDIYGDVSFETVYKDFTDKNGIKIPSTRIDYEYGKPERELTYSDLRFDLKPDTSNLRIKWLPEYFRKKLSEPVSAKEQFEFSTISPTLDLVKILSQNNKALIAKFADYIALFEVPQGIDLNIQLIEELKKRYPDRPLRYLFVTHHHPDHAGGIRAYANQQITLITTAGNKEYFEKILTTSHSIGINKALYNEPIKLKMEFVPLTGDKIVKDKFNEVIGYEIGANTSHTSEHLAYYFPKSKILWTGDLLFFDQKETVYPAGARGKSIYDLIQTKKLAVGKIYTSWPLHGQKEFGTVDFLKKLVASN